MDRIRLRPTPRSSRSAPRRPADDAVLLAVPRSQHICRNTIMGDHGTSSGHLPATALALPALCCSCNIERVASRRLNLATAIKNDIAGWTAPTARSQDRAACLGDRMHEHGPKGPICSACARSKPFRRRPLVDKVNAALPAPSELFGCSRRYRRCLRNRCCVGSDVVAVLHSLPSDC